MFEAFQESIRRAAEAVQAKYDGFTDSVDKLNKDMLEIRDMFVTTKDIIVSIFSFLGQETTILLFCTFLFLFVANLIPFLFLSKKARYFIGIGFGTYLSISFGYTFWSLTKYIFIMLSPLLLEYLLALFFRKAGKYLWALLKKTAIGLWKLLKVLWRRLLKKNKKDEESEKTSSQTAKNL
ncbi:MAG: hypothetical protein J5787_05705 [Alphaproteobacteria bacterium]|nr:hypothetical protein [Alphaproteobacteria bacterium]MBO4643020.1 hypothetical protein [Alphaproteobacteria bacterium]